MKKKTKETKKNHPVSREQIQKEICDEAYRQINTISFKQNFKALIGHYKNQELGSRSN